MARDHDTSAVANPAALAARFISLLPRFATDYLGRRHLATLLPIVPGEDDLVIEQRYSA